jgi:hypothetical protein
MHDLLGYLLNLDEPEERERVEAYLRGNPDAAQTLAALQKALAPLEADREPPVPPSHLVSRTIGRVAELACQQGSAPPDVMAGPAAEELLRGMTPAKWKKLAIALDRANAPPSRWRRADYVVLASIVFVGMGLILSAVPMIRQRQSVQTCQNQLRQVYQSLDTYAETHGGAYPKVTDTALPGISIATVEVTLKQSGTFPATLRLGCNGSDQSTISEYAYSLGYRNDDGTLNGLRRDPQTPGWDLLPIAADQSPYSRSPSVPVHDNGQNVLFLGGNVRFCTATTVGYDGDEIYWNKNGKVRAGLGMWDTSLGVGTDRP